MSTEVDLDLTPMMSMFLILLPFLVSMAVLTHLTIIEFSLPPNIGPSLQQSSQEKPKLKLTVVVKPEYVLITHGEQLLDSLPLAETNQTYDSLSRLLVKHRADIEVKDELVLASNDRVKLKTIVRLMDVGKSSGFSNIGLSSATDDPGEGK